jgi:CDP-diacylglycerol---glycerol-3-phosphate 3-phosphatidyltransferase
VGIYSVKPGFRKLLRKSASSLAARGVAPDQVTAAGIAASAVGALGFAAGRVNRKCYAVVPAAAAVRITANALDGLVAEIQGSGRPAGELFNETADRVGDILFLSGAAIVPGAHPACSFAAVAASQLGSFIGVTSKAAGGRRRYDGPMGKPDRMLVLGVAGMVLARGNNHACIPGRVINVANTAIAAGACVTIWNRYRRAHAELEGGRAAL